MFAIFFLLLLVIRMSNVFEYETKRSGKRIPGEDRKEEQTEHFSMCTVWLFVRNDRIIQTKYTQRLWLWRIQIENAWCFTNSSWTIVRLVCKHKKKYSSLWIIFYLVMVTCIRADAFFFSFSLVCSICQNTLTQIHPKYWTWPLCYVNVCVRVMHVLVFYAMKQNQNVFDVFKKNENLDDDEEEDGEKNRTLVRLTEKKSNTYCENNCFCASLRSFENSAPQNANKRGCCCWWNEWKRGKIT